MKIRGIEISIGVHNWPYAILGVVPLDIDVPAELTKTTWTPLELLVDVLTSKGRHSEVVRIPFGDWDGSFNISQEMISMAAAELRKRIEEQRVQLAAPSLNLAEDLAMLAETLEEERWHEAKLLVASLRERFP